MDLLSTRSGTLNTEFFDADGHVLYTVETRKNMMNRSATVISKSTGTLGALDSAEILAEIEWGSASKKDVLQLKGATADMEEYMSEPKKFSM